MSKDIKRTMSVGVLPMEVLVEAKIKGAPFWSLMPRTQCTHWRIMWVLGECCLPYKDAEAGTW